MPPQVLAPLCSGIGLIALFLMIIINMTTKVEEEKKDGIE